MAANETDSDLSNNTAFADTTVITILDNYSDGIPDSIDPDDDNDGMPDTYELANLFNPLNASDAATDADGDGYSNLSEYRAGSDPRDPASVPSYVPMPWLPLLLE